MTTTTKPKKTTTTSSPLSLHDSLALGEVELGLLSKKHQTQTSSSTDLEEIHRLPVLLRLLSSARPLSSIPTFPGGTTEQEEGVSQARSETEGTNENNDDPITNQVVTKLEDVAATYSVAEGVDVVACHLAPTICRKLSRLTPIKPRKKKRQQQQECVEWETKELAAVAANPFSRFKRRRVSTAYYSTNKSSQNNNDTGAGDSEDEIQMSEEEDEAPTSGNDANNEKTTTTENNGGNNNNNITSEHRRSSMESMRGSIGSVGGGGEGGGMQQSQSQGVMTEDSQEANVTKTLSELATLVVSSLEPIKKNKIPTTMEESSPAATNNSNNPTTTTAATTDTGGFVGNSSNTKDSGATLFLAEDSNLAAPSQTYQSSSNVDSSSIGGVTVGSSDLGSTVAALMHHASVLRHRHVAVRYWGKKEYLYCNMNIFCFKISSFSIFIYYFVFLFCCTECSVSSCTSTSIQLDSEDGSQLSKCCA